MNNDERTLYSALISLRNQESALRWTRSQLFIIIHSAGFSIVTTLQLQQRIGFRLLFWAGVFGLMLAVLWFLATIRANELIQLWHFRLSMLENHLADTPERIFNSKEYVRVANRPRWVGIGTILIRLIVFFGLLWSFVIMWAFFV